MTGDRKQYPITTGVLDFFPDAIVEVARVSVVSTEQHHPGQPVHWDRDKSTDEADALARHLLERGTRDTDGLRHTAKVAWRALALLQREIEAEQAALKTAIAVQDSPHHPRHEPNGSVGAELTRFYDDR